MNRCVKFIWIVIFPFALFNCTRSGQSEDSDTNIDADKSIDRVDSAASIEVTTYDENSLERTLSLNIPARRVIASNQSSLEILFALGVADRVVGWSYPDNERWPAFEELYDTVELLSKTYPAQEVVIGAKPDLIIGWKSFFSGVLGHDDLTRRGIAAYTRKNSGIGDWSHTMENEFDDIRSIGRLLGVDEQAEGLIEQMRQRMNEVDAAVSTWIEDESQSNRPLVIAVEVSDNGNYTLYGPNALIADMIVRAGGVYHPDAANGMREVSKETLLLLDPDVIVFPHFYTGVGDSEGKFGEFFVDDTVLSRLKASRQNRFIPIPLTMSYASGVLMIEGFELIARGLYPDLSL